MTRPGLASMAAAIVASIVISSAVLSAAGLAVPAHADRFLDHLAIQQTTDPKLVAKPALFQYVAKKDVPDVWIVNLGVKFDVLAALEADISKYLELGPAFDYQRNTAADKEQDMLKAGVTLDAYTGALEERAAVALLASSVSYTRDGVKDTSGLQVKGSATIVAKGCAKHWRCVWRPNVTTDLVVADFVYTPLLGLEYDHAFEAAMAVDEGYAVRAVPRLVAAAYLAPSVFGHRVELVADLTARGDLFGSLADGWHPLVKLSGNLYVYRNTAKGEAAGIGIDYIDGEDPDAGLADQTLVQISLKVML